MGVLSGDLYREWVRRRREREWERVAEVVEQQREQQEGHDAAGDRRPPLVTKRTLVGIGIFVLVLAYFLTQSRLPAILRKFEVVERAATARGTSAFGEVLDPNAYAAALRWVAYGVNLWDANATGMFFAMLLGGAAVAAFAPGARMRRLLTRKGAVGAGVGGAMGLPLFLCSACSAPVSMGFYRNGAAVETSLGMILGSALFNPVAVVAIFLLFPLPMALARMAFGLAAIFGLAPLAARAPGRVLDPVVLPEVCPVPAPEAERPPAGDDEGWGRALRHGVAQWLRNSTEVAFRLAPPMLIATFVVGIVFTLVPPQQLSDRLGSGIAAVVIVAAVGTLLQLPTLFEIPLVLGVLALGLGPGPAAALLVTAPSAGVVTLAITRSDLGWRAPSLLLAGTFVGGVVAGVVVGAL